MQELSAIISPIESELNSFRQLFESSLESSNPLLSEALLHIKQKKGKMMRPILVLLISRLYGCISNETFHAAVSLELLHTASLVHDDVVDESNERRGQPSVNALYNNKVSVLVGDFLLATSLVQVGQTNNSRIIEVVAKLGQDLSEGELLQLANIDTSDFSIDRYFTIIKKKTAALFSACTEAAILSTGIDDEEQIEEARLFGEYLGTCFQIKDDLFDYFDSDNLGKPTGLDMLEGKLTLPVLYVINNGEKSEWSRGVALKVKSGDASDKEVQELIDFTIEHGGIDYAKEIMMDYHKKALALIDHLPNNDVKCALISYLNYIVNRNK